MHIYILLSQSALVSNAVSSLGSASITITFIVILAGQDTPCIQPVAVVSPVSLRGSTHTRLSWFTYHRRFNWLLKRRRRHIYVETSQEKIVIRTIVTNNREIYFQNIAYIFGDIIFILFSVNLIKL
jgi:hypothetical protein